MDSEQIDPTDETSIVPPKPILRINEVSSFLDLKTEFLTRRQVATGKNYPAKYVHKTKNNILSITREEKNDRKEISALRSVRIKKKEELLQNETAERQRQRRILENKATIYERMSKGENLVYEDGKSADFLVNFEAKKRELEELQSRDIFQSECEQAVIEPPLIVHFDHTEDKGRVFGASHVPLPFLDEESRQKTISELKDMTVQTNLERAKRKKIRNVKKNEERRRLNRLRIQKGLELLKSSDEDECDSCEAKTEDSLDDIPLPPTQTTTIIGSSETAKAAEIKKPRLGVREWDRGKTGYMKWITAQREERDEEFRPPQFY